MVHKLWKPKEHIDLIYPVRAVVAYIHALVPEVTIGVL